MWEITKYDKNTEQWSVLEIVQSIDDCKKWANDTKELPESIYYFWSGEYPTEKEEKKKVIKEMFDINNDRILNIFPGIQITIEKDSAKCKCPGRCFCVIDSNGCHCGTSYCRPNGCIWVRCPGNC